MSAEWAIRSTRVVTPAGVREAGVVIRGEKIVSVVEPREIPAGLRVEDVGELVVSPGLVDIHVHVNEPGRTEWEGFATATAAAAAGGVTTIVDMPLNSSPVTTTVAAFQEKLAAAEGNCRVDVGFYGGSVPGNAEHVGPLADAGTLGIKAFLCNSGLDEFPASGVSDLRAAMSALAGQHVPVLVHCELMHANAPQPSDPKSYFQYCDSRPDAWEIDAIALMIDLCREFHQAVHVVHLSSAEALPLIADAKADGLPLTVETCPHYLYFSAERISDGDTRFKCAPPIRSESNRQRLWDGLRTGLIDTIGSDHSPCPPEMKCLNTGDFTTAWGGIASLQFTLPVVWTEASRRGVSLVELAAWLSERPAKLIGIDSAKGRLEPGCDADFVVWDPDAEFDVTPETIRHRHKITPYRGEQLRGAVRRTYLRGRMVFGDGALSGKPRGTFLLGGNCGRGETTDSDEPDARDVLRRCCAARRWIDGMLAARPFADEEELIQMAGKIWWSLEKNDWLEAFQAHPKIGDVDSLREKFSDTKQLAVSEQAGIQRATEDTLQQLAAGNEEYQEKFGFMFIVFATGKSAEEMLTLLRERLPNGLEEELRIAAAEQLKITQLRLQNCESMIARL